MSTSVTFKPAAPPSAGSLAGPTQSMDLQQQQDRDGMPQQEKQKLGHRRIDIQGEVSYKKVPTNALMSSIQLGIANSIGSLASKPTRDLLLQDFDKIETVTFPAAGSAQTPSHSFGDFRFKTYAPIAFRHFRELFNIKPADFLRSICTEPMKELVNAGASGSIFYVSHDDQFIIKTVQHKEAEFLQKLLPGYYMNLKQNPRTMLPKFFGLFCYQSLGKNIRLIVMNNLLPQKLTMHEKYDLKGSTYKRLASKAERSKSYPTLKDLDFVEVHKDGGILVDKDILAALLNTISRDCLVLESFKIMDYSLLIGVHNMDLAAQTEGERDNRTYSEDNDMEVVDDQDQPGTSRDTERSHRPLQAQFSVLQTSGEGPMGNGVPARNEHGDRLILYMGIIDILQNYRLLKKMEHTWKAILHDGDSISVHNPNFYAQRFLSFMSDHVFRQAPALKQSPSRRRTARRSVGEENSGGAAGGDAPVSARDVQPMMPVRVPLRRSYRADTITDMKKEKKTERLFGGPTSARGTVTDDLQETGEEEVTRL